MARLAAAVLALLAAGCVGTGGSSLGESRDGFTASGESESLFPDSLSERWPRWDVSPGWKDLRMPGETWRIRVHPQEEFVYCTVIPSPPNGVLMSGDLQRLIAVRKDGQSLACPVFSREGDRILEAGGLASLGWSELSVPDLREVRKAVLDRTWFGVTAAEGLSSRGGWAVVGGGLVQETEVCLVTGDALVTGPCVGTGMYFCLDAGWTKARRCSF